LKIKGIIWLDKIIDKLATEHNVGQNEVLEVLDGRAVILSARNMTPSERRRYVTPPSLPLFPSYVICLQPLTSNGFRYLSP